MQSRVCQDCGFRTVEYARSPNGNLLRSGYCRECYEDHTRRLLRDVASVPVSRRGVDSKEDVLETKYGVDR